MVHRAALLSGLLLTGAVALAGCAEPESSTVGNEANTLTVVACELPSTTSDECHATVRRLNEGLAEVLKEALPAGAEVASNMEVQGRPGLALGTTFFAAPGEDGSPGYQAPLRVRVGELTGNLDIAVQRYTAVPDTDGCPDQARLDEMKSKGMEQNRCDRHKVVDTVVVVHATAEPYGSGEFADMKLHHLSITAYRGGGVKVSASLSPVIERVPQDAADRQAVTRNILTLEQLERLALDPAFAVL